MTKYIVNWTYNGRNYSASYDSLRGAEQMRLSLLSEGYDIKDVSIQVVQL